MKTPSKNQQGILVGFQIFMLAFFMCLICTLLAVGGCSTCLTWQVKEFWACQQAILTGNTHRNAQKCKEIRTCAHMHGIPPFLVAQCSAISAGVATARVARSFFARNFSCNTVTEGWQDRRDKVFFLGGYGRCSATPPRHL